MMWVVVFVLFFVGGPLLFRLFTRPAPSRRSIRVLGMLTAALALGSLALQYGFPQLWGAHLSVTVAGILLIWLAWIGVLAFGAQALRRSDPSARMYRLTGVIGALGTTVPWFGLASADMVGF